MAQKSRTKKDKQIEELSTMISSNVKATLEGPRKKHFSPHDIKSIKPLNHVQESMFESFFQGNNIIAHGSAGTGKAQPLYAKVMTPNGWKLMGDLQINDEIITPQGKTAKIVGVFPQGKKDIYEITFSDGSKTRACLDHLWECNVPKDLKYRRYSEKKIISTEQIIEILQTKSKHTNVSIDLVSGVEYENKNFELDPYLLGVLIGDGCLRTTTPSFTSLDDEIIQTISQLLVDDYKLTRNKMSYNICQKSPKKDGSPNYYKILLDKLGLQGKLSKDKHIPEIYKTGSLAQRISLIQGLLDTDGTVDKNGSISFSTSSNMLASDVQNILWSIGAKCSITKKNPFYYDKHGNKKFGLTNYVLHISYKNPKSLFRLTRKRGKCSDQYDPNQLRRQVKSITFVGHEEAQCIMIDDEKHLYITDDYIITHNTFIGLHLALNEMLNKQNGISKIIIIRSIVSSRDIGFLPGGVDEKLEPYETTYKDIVNHLLGKYDAYDTMKSLGCIEFIPTSFVRGLTWDNSIIFMDEIQNMNFHEINSAITRTGENSRIIACGDVAQNDLFNKKNDLTGMPKFLNVARRSSVFDEIIFTRDDIVRSGFVKKWICAVEDDDANNIPSLKVA